MAACKSLAEVEKKIKNAVNNSLRGIVADDVIKHGFIHYAQEDVYDAYKEPKKYGRRESLTKSENYLVEPEDMKIYITPVATFNDTPMSENSGNELAGLINYGGGGAYKGYDYDYPIINSEYYQPRPFIDDTYEALNTDVGYVLILTDALESEGLKVINNA